MKKLTNKKEKEEQEQTTQEWRMKINHKRKNWPHHIWLFVLEPLTMYIT